MTQINVRSDLSINCRHFGVLVGSLVPPSRQQKFRCSVRHRRRRLPPSPTGKLLTIEDAVRIGLDNHPRIKASERTESGLSKRCSVNKCQLIIRPSAWSISYRTTQSSTNGGNDHAADAFSSQGDR